MDSPGVDERASSLAALTDEIEDRSRALVDATRRFSTGQWRRSAGTASAEDIVQALVTALAALEHAVEVGAGERPAVWRSPSPAPYPGALPDRLAVVAGELVAALRSAPSGHAGWRGDTLVPLPQLAADALERTRAAAAVVDQAARR